MAWAIHEQGQYVLRLTDGFIVPAADAPDRPDWSSPQDTREQRLAQYLYRSGKGLNSLEVKRQQRSDLPDQLHVWVVGSEDWIVQAPPEVARICEEEVKEDPSERSSYRMVIIGERLASVKQPYVWSTRLCGSGLFRRKSYGSKRFQHVAEPLLKCMAEYSDQMLASPTPILQTLRVPHAFYGDA